MLKEGANQYAIKTIERYYRFRQSASYIAIRIQRTKGINQQKRSLVK